MPRSNLSLAVDNSRFDVHDQDDHGTTGQVTAAQATASNSAALSRWQRFRALVGAALRRADALVPSPEVVRQTLINRLGLNLHQIARLQSFVEWGGVYLGVLGSLILASRLGTTVDLITWCIVFTSNVMLIAFGLLIGSRGILVLQGAIMGTAILGIARAAMDLTSKAVVPMAALGDGSSAQMLEMLMLLERAAAMGGI